MQWIAISVIVAFAVFYIARHIWRVFNRKDKCGGNCPGCPVQNCKQREKNKYI